GCRPSAPIARSPASSTGCWAVPQRGDPPIGATWTQPVTETEPPAILTVPAEARSFQGDRAGIVSRVLANAVDHAVLVVLGGDGYLGWSAWLFLRRGAGFRFPTVTCQGTY